MAASANRAKSLLPTVFAAAASLTVSFGAAQAQSSGFLGYSASGCAERSCWSTFSGYAWRSQYSYPYQRDPDEPRRRWNTLLLERQGALPRTPQLRASSTTQFEVVNR